jgi:hypothetical protein
MKKLSFIFLLVFAVSIPDVTSQNLGSFLEKKAKQAAKRAGQKADQEVTEEMNKKVDEGVEKVFENIFSTEETEEQTEAGEKSSSSASEAAITGALMKSMGMSMSPANVEEAYHFSGNIIMTVETWDSDGNSLDPMKYTTHFSQEYSSFAMDFTQNNQRSVMIFDTRNGAMIILTDDGTQKTGIVTAYAKDTIQEIIEEENETIEDYSIYNENLKKTGKSKTIAGYKCDEYSFENEYSQGNVWLTDEVSANIWAKMVSSNVIAASKAGYYGGFVMEMDQISKETGQRTFLQVREVNENSPSSISTKEYQLMSFGSEMPEEDEESNGKE